MSASRRSRRPDDEARVRHMLDAANRAVELPRDKKILEELKKDDTEDIKD